MFACTCSAYIHLDWQKKAQQLLQLLKGLARTGIEEGKKMTMMSKMLGMQAIGCTGLYKFPENFLS